MVKKKNKKKKTNSKAVKVQLGKKKETAREKMIGQTIGYRYDVNLLPDYERLTPFLKKYIARVLYRAKLGAKFKKKLNGTYRTKINK